MRTDVARGSVLVHCHRAGRADPPASCPRQPRYRHQTVRSSDRWSWRRLATGHHLRKRHSGASQEGRNVEVGSCHCTHIAHPPHGHHPEPCLRLSDCRRIVGLGSASPHQPCDYQDRVRRHTGSAGPPSPLRGGQQDGYCNGVPRAHQVSTGQPTRARSVPRRFQRQGRTGLERGRIRASGHHPQGRCPGLGRTAAPLPA